MDDVRLLGIGPSAEVESCGEDFDEPRAAQEHRARRWRVVVGAAATMLFGTLVVFLGLTRRSLADDPIADAGGIAKLFGGRAHAAPPLESRSLGQGWDKQAGVTVMCTVDILKAMAYLGNAVYMLNNASLVCPQCGVPVSIALTSLAWAVTYVSAAAQDCRESLHVPGTSYGAVCSSAVARLVSNLLEVVVVGQAIGSDCDFGPDAPPRNASRPRPPGAAVGAALRRRFRALGLGAGAAPEAFDGLHGLVNAAGAPRALGRRLAGRGGAVAGLLARRRAREAERSARQWNAAVCSFDITQAVTYVVRAVFQLHSAAERCPDPSACSVDVLNAISSFAWIAQYTSLAVNDCALTNYKSALCSNDISDLVAAVANGAATGMVIEGDCAHQ